MPEKTLKEKVEWARVALVTNSPETEQAVQEALTALEEELQRARDALRWIPCEERPPEKSGNYRTTLGVNPVGVKGILSILSFSYFDAQKGEWLDADNVIAWMEKPAPYTPEEK